MKRVGDGKSLGLYTGLQISFQFANAVLHCLKDHPLAARRDRGGVLLPIDDAQWQATFRVEFPNIQPRKYGHTQPLKTYCGYYNQGQHGLGYDLEDRFDFGEGRRDVQRQREGNSVAGTERAVYPGSASALTPLEIIQAAKSLWDEFHADGYPRRLSQELDRLSTKLEADGYFDVTTVEDERTRVLREVVQRHGQRRFRDELLQAYERRCAITGCDTEQVLEAAHITPYAGKSTDHVQNGLLLRSDIHTLFDLDLIGIDPELLVVHVSAAVLGTEHADLAGKQLSVPAAAKLKPAKSSLQERWKSFEAKNHSRKCRPE